jgi:hypothetical protein
MLELSEISKHAPGRLAIAVLTAALFAACAGQQQSPSAAVATAPQTASPSSQLPPGLPVEAAKAKAAAVAPLEATFAKATAGRYGDFPPDLRDGTVDPDRAVWAITYDSTGTVCYPGSSVCESPRPGAVTVFLDYYTGDFVGTAGWFPKPYGLTAPRRLK